MMHRIIANRDRSRAAIIAAEYSCLEVRDILLIGDFVESHCRRWPGGHYVECGVFNGGMAAYMAYLFQEYSLDVQCWLFDSFMGMPQPSPIDGKRATWKYEQQKGAWLQGDPETIRAAFKALNVKRPPFICAGDFEATLPKAIVSSIGLLYADADWYISTLPILYNLFDKLTGGAVIILDDYHHWPGVAKALRAFGETRGVDNPKTKRLTYSAAYVRKKWLNGKAQN